MVLMLCFVANCTFISSFYKFIFQKRKEKTGKKEKRKLFGQAGQGVLSRFLTFYLIH
jgi:hypothetical protein